MCGFLGVITKAQSSVPLVSPEIFSSMLKTLFHRGPDSQKVWQDNQVQLGFSRLAILDLSPAGEQPMAAEEWIIVLNGEIYNFLDLKKRLDQEASIAWRGHSDTEVVLECLRHWGIEKTLKELEGMFALAIYNIKEQKVFLAKDRLGEKPLYYGLVGSHLAFASELKALTKHPQWKGELNREAITNFLRFGYVPTPLSIYKNISKLEPGTYLEINLKDLAQTKKSYWAISKDLQAVYGTQKISFDEAILGTEKILTDVIQKEMVADVPLGAFLSGGVDSSTVVALMQKSSTRPVKTFSIGFEQKDYNEAVYAKAVAKHLGTEHTELYVSDTEAMKVIPQLAKIFDEPFADSSQIPTLLVSQMAKKQVTVCLSGDGGDEVFAGYNRYQHAPHLWNKMQQLPYTVRKAAQFVSEKIPPHIYDHFSGLLGVARAGEKIQKIQKILGAKSEEELFLKLISFWNTGNNEIHFESWAKNFAEKLMLHDLSHYLPDDILVKVDRSMMFHSLEGRIPFLHHQVVEWAWSLPLEYKLNQGETKSILRKVLYRHVPQDLIERPKMGFGIPLDHWLRGPLKDWAQRYFDQAKQGKIFESLEMDIEKTWHDHLKGTTNSQHELWNVLILMQWLEEHGYSVKDL